MNARFNGWATAGLWTRHAGPTMRAVLRAEDQWGVWEHLLPIYADAQLQLATRRDELIASSVPDRGPARLPGLLRSLTTRLAGVGPERGGLDAGQAAAIERLIPIYDAWCEQLVASGIEDSVQQLAVRQTQDVFTVDTLQTDDRIQTYVVHGEPPLSVFDSPRHHIPSQDAGITFSTGTLRKACHVWGAGPCHDEWLESGHER